MRQKSTSGGENSNKISAKSSKSFGKGNYSFVRKATDDPNLIYGRDFDDETIELQNVLGEMGEITIRGKVISMETERSVMRRRSLCLQLQILRILLW